MKPKNKASGSNYYYIDESRKASKKGWLYVFVHVLLIVLTLGLSAGLVMAYLSTGVSPNENWVFSFFGLVAPFLFLGNFITLLLWVIRWKRWFIIPLLTLLFGLGHLRALVQFRFKKEYPETTVGRGVAAKRAEQLTVMTYNVHGFWYEQKGRAGYNKNLDSIAAYSRRRQPDIICFQELETTNRSDVRRVDSLFRAWPHREINYSLGGDGRIGFGTAIFSKLPVVRSRKVIFERSGNSTMYADIVMSDEDTVRIFNNHLQTTQIDDISRRRVERLDVGRGDTEQLMRNMGSRLKSNYKRRAVQVDTVSQMVRQSPYPVVVTGDFNDTPVSYTYRKMRGDLVDPFIEAGSGYAYTYNRLFALLRIDYIFHSSAFESISYRSDDLPWSDHNPAIVRLQKKRAE